LGLGFKRGFSESMLPLTKKEQKRDKKDKMNDWPKRMPDSCGV
jgi:hypothetical protein